MSVVGPPGGHEDATESGLMVDGINIGRGDTRGSNDLKDEPASRIGGGQMEWSIPLSNAAGQPLSTPALSDLDLDGTLEIVVASASDQVFTLNPNGNYYWDEPYGDDVIEPLGQPAFTFGLDYEPPPFFTSVTSKDVNLGDTPDIILGVKNGVLSIGSDGGKQWKRGLTTGYYFSTACITDLDGTWSGNKDELEIAISSDDESNRGWLEALEGNGRSILREVAPTESGLVGCTVVASDMDGNPERGPYAMPPDPEDELDTELVLCYPGVPLSIFMRNGTDPSGFPIYDQSIMVKDPDILVFGTPAVGNITGGPECEIIVPFCKGYGNWTNWTGGIRCYNYTGSLLWDLPLGGKGSGVSSSPAVAVFARGSDGPEQKIIVFGSDNGRVYAVDPESHNFLWQFDTGGRVLSSPAICNIDNDDELEMVIGSDSGMVFCFDLDPSDGVDEGISHPGDGYLYDVLWAYNTSTPIGISSPVIADIDLDRQLEVVLGDSNGTLYCISAGGSSVKGQIDWPEFHNDHNRTGVHRSRIVYGVDIYAKRDSHGKQETTIKRVEPGEMVTFNITVENTGDWLDETYEEKIIVGIQERSVHEGWKAWLDTPPDSSNDNPGYVRLASGEKADLILYVHAPWEGDFFELALINVTAVSSSEPKANAHIILTAVLDICPSFDLYFNWPYSEDPNDPPYLSKWDRILDGDTATYDIYLENTGPINDTYMVQLSPPPEGTGWDWYFEDTGGTNKTVFLNSPIFLDMWGGTSKARLVLKVKAPDIAEEGSRVTIPVNATSEMSASLSPPGVIDKDELMMVFGHAYYPPPIIEPSLLYVMPGRTEQVIINLSNIGNKDVVHYNVTLVDDDVPFKVECPTEPVPVTIGSSLEIHIRITAKVDVIVGDVYELTFSAIPEEAYWPMPENRGILKVFIGREHGLSVDPSSFNLGAEGGEVLSLRMRLSSLWNGSDLVVPGVVGIEQDWSVRYGDEGGETVENIMLSNLSSKSIRAFVSVPKGTVPGLHFFELAFHCSGPYGTILLVPVLINVTEMDGENANRSGVRVTSQNGQSSVQLDMEVEEVRDIWVRISNTGNIRDTIVAKIETISGDAPDGGWGFQVLSIGLEDRDTRSTVQKNLRLPIVIYDIGPDEMFVPTDGSKDITGFTLVMELNSSVWVHLRISGPPRSLMTTVKDSVWALTCKVPDNSASDTLVLLVDPQYPDLRFSGDVMMDGRADRTVLRSSGQVNVSLIVMNGGEVHCSGFRVIVRVNGAIASVKQVGALGSYENKMLTFLFKVGNGEHKITIEIDPDNDVVESADQVMDGGVNDNNVYETTIKVEEKKGHPYQNIWLLLLLAAVIILAIMLVLNMIRSHTRDRKVGEVKGRQEEE